MKNNSPASHPACYRRAGILLFILANLAAGAQSKLGFDNYNYISQPGEAVFVPMFHLATKNNWYTELRYNYEDAQTISLFVGKILEGGDEIEYMLTPMAGYSAGRFTGLSLGMNTDAEWKDFTFSAQSQYSIAMKNNTNDFFFNWSELTYSINDRLFTGLAMQYTMQEKQESFEPGIVAGLSFNSISFPIYAFNPFRSNNYFVVGLNYEYKLGKKNKSSIKQF